MFPSYWLTTRKSEYFFILSPKCRSHEARVSWLPREKWETQGKVSWFRSYKAVSRPLGHYFIFLYPRAPLFLFYNHDSMGKTCVESRHHLYSTEIRILSVSSHVTPGQRLPRFLSTISDDFKVVKTALHRRWAFLKDPMTDSKKGQNWPGLELFLKSHKKSHIKIFLLPNCLFQTFCNSH